MSEGKMVIFSGPSGAGKTTIVQQIVKNHDELRFSISACTRVKRENEVEGEHYIFMTIEDFHHKVEENAFMEWEKVYEGHFYGTLKSEVEKIWDEGHHPIFDIDVQGAINLKKSNPDKAMSIFIKPPSEELLAKRLEHRLTESVESLEMRLKKAKNELKFEGEFDHVIINVDLTHSVNEAEKLVRSFLNN
ncbi:MAG: guanylate kinase [Bacteroidetes bacterium]|nr:guanylate kinase [Bacteroidota bacterium]